MKNPTHLLLDLDGTLLGSTRLRLKLDFIWRAIQIFKPFAPERTARRSAARVVIEIQKGLALPPTEAEVGMTNAERAAMIFAHKFNLNSQDAGTILRKAMFSIFPNLKKHFFPILPASRFLEWAHENYPLVLATDPIWPRPLIEMRMNWAGIPPAYFNFISDSEIMHACKPTRAYYLEVLQKCKLESNDCILVGNDKKMDSPAVEVGIPVFIISKSIKLKSLSTAQFKNPAPAFTGNYTVLRKFLETLKNG